MSELVTLDNPATGETYTFVQRSADTGGALLQMHWSVAPGGRIGEHIHPLQEERFDVTEGILTISVEKQLARVGAGQSATVPAGARHWFANEMGARVSAVLELRPALRMEKVFETLSGFACDGKARSDGLPRNPLLLAVFAAEYKDEIRGVRPPYVIQRVLLPAAARLGRALGHVAHQPHYRSD